MGCTELPGHANIQKLDSLILWHFDTKANISICKNCDIKQEWETILNKPLLKVWTYIKKKHLLQRIKITKTEISSEKIYSSFNLSIFFKLSSGKKH